MGWLLSWIERAFPFGMSKEVREEMAGVWTPVRGKPRVRVLPDGWVRHAPGAFPFDPVNCWVVVLFECGDRADAQRAGYWPDEWWKGRSHDWRWNIVAYRMVRSPRLRI